MKIIFLLIKNSLNFVLSILIDNKSVLVLVMAWQWTDYKPVSEPVMTKIFNAIQGQRSTISINSLASGRCGINLKSRILKIIMQNSSLGIHHEIALR